MELFSFQDYIFHTEIPLLKQPITGISVPEKSPIIPVLDALAANVILAVVSKFL